MGQPFRPQLRRRSKMAVRPPPAVILDDFISGSANDVIQDGDRKRKGRHFTPPPQRGSKRPPQILVDVISGAAILESRWRHRELRLEGVETPMKTSSRCLSHPQKGVILVEKRHADVLSYFCFLRSIWSLASPSHSRNGWGSCPLASTYSPFFIFFNCTLQYSWFHVEYSAIVGRNLVWLESNLAPLWPFFSLDSINQPTMYDFGYHGMLRKKSLHIS